MYILTSDDTKSYPYFFVWSFIKQVSLVGQQEGQLAVRLKELSVSTISDVSSDLSLTFPFQHDTTTSFITQ